MSLLATLLSVWVVLTPATAHASSPMAAASPPAALLLVVASDDVPGRAGLEDRLHAALGARVLDLATTNKIKADLHALGLSCARVDERCAAGHGQFIGVGEVVVVAFERAGSSWLVRAERVNSVDARVLDAAVGRLATRPDDGGVGAEVVAANLFASPRAPVLVPLHVGALPAGATLRVDGAVVAVDGDVVWLPPGAHAVVVDGAPAAAARAVALDDRAPGARVALAVAALPTPAATTTTTTTPPTATTTSAAARVVPLAVLAAGTVVSVAGGGFALFVDQQLDPRSGPHLTDSERASTERSGQLAVGVAAVGVVGVVVGLALLGSTP
jgi:hypothetical protein